MQLRLAVAMLALSQELDLLAALGEDDGTTCVAPGCLAAQDGEEDSTALLQSPLGHSMPKGREMHTDLVGWNHNALSANGWGPHQLWDAFRAILKMASGVAVPIAEAMEMVRPGVADMQGLLQIFESLKQQPPLPGAAQVAAACPSGKNCTPSAVMDAAKQHSFGIGGFFAQVRHGLGVCYNAPLYYAEECIASKVSPLARALMQKPTVVPGKTCEDLGFPKEPAFYADPFYLWGNNVSLFVSGGPMEWLPVIYGIGTCHDCVESLFNHGWGMEWRKMYPQCGWQKK
jgi:hypothetical protein